MDKPKSPTNFGDFSAVELMFVILARGKGHESKIMNDNNNMDWTHFIETWQRAH